MGERTSEQKIERRLTMPNKNKGPTKNDLQNAIRRKCLDCSGGMRNEVRNCLVKDCPLRPYRIVGLESETTLLDTLEEGINGE